MLHASVFWMRSWYVTQLWRHNKITSTVALHLTLNISKTVRDRGLVPKGLPVGNGIWCFQGHMTDYVMWPWKVKLVTPICLERNISKTTWARDFKFGMSLCIGRAERRTNNYPESVRGLGHVTPTIFGILSNISLKLLELETSNLIHGFVWAVPSRRINNFPERRRGLGHVTLIIFGSTVGYSSDSLASCFCWYTKCWNPPRNVKVIVQNKVARFFMADGV